MPVLAFASYVDIWADRHQELTVADEVGRWRHRRRQTGWKLNLSMRNDLFEKTVLAHTSRHIFQLLINVILLGHLFGEHRVRLGCHERLQMSICCRDLVLLLLGVGTLSHVNSLLIDDSLISNYRHLISPIATILIYVGAVLLIINFRREVFLLLSCLHVFVCSAVTLFLLTEILVVWFSAWWGIVSKRLLLLIRSIAWGPHKAWVFIFIDFSEFLSEWHWRLGHHRFALLLCVFELLCEKNFAHLLHRDCRLNIDPLTLNLVLVSNLKHQIDTPNITVSHETKASRPLCALILQNDDVINRTILLEIQSELS